MGGRRGRHLLRSTLGSWHSVSAPGYMPACASSDLGRADIGSYLDRFSWGKQPLSLRH